MKSILKRNNWLILKIVVFITILVPIGITAYEFVVLGNNSVVFLGDYPSSVGIIIAIYYAIILVVGLIWLVMQLKSVLNLKNETKKNELLHLQSQVNPDFFFKMLKKEDPDTKELFVYYEPVNRHLLFYYNVYTKYYGYKIRSCGPGNGIANCQEDASARVGDKVLLCNQGFMQQLNDIYETKELRAKGACKLFEITARKEK